MKLQFYFPDYNFWEVRRFLLVDMIPELYLLLNTGLNNPVKSRWLWWVCSTGWDL